jgi:hypothetical protein
MPPLGCPSVCPGHPYTAGCQLTLSLDHTGLCARLNIFISHMPLVRVCGAPQLQWHRKRSLDTGQDGWEMGRPGGDQGLGAVVLTAPL